MAYGERKATDMFYFNEVVAQLRNYIRYERPQSFALTWNLFIKCYTKVKEYGVRKADVLDLFEYAQRERIEKYGSEITGYKNVA